MESKTSTFINKSNLVHNEKYDYSQTNYINSYTKVIIICQIHGIFEQIPSNHLRGNGCNKCASKIRVASQIVSQQQFIERSNQIHNSKYDYSQLNYINTQTKVSIICQTHGSFEQLPTHHLNGSGCKKCSQKTVAKTNTTSQQQFIDKSNSIHNKKYDYSQTIYTNSYNKVSIICQTHGLFEQLPGSHLRGHGCIKCLNKTEGVLYQWLQTEFPSFNIIYQHTSDWLKFKGRQSLDFYIEDLNLAIECQGRQHFQDVEYFKSKLQTQQQRDNNKLQLLKQQNISIIYIYQQDIWDNNNDWQSQLKNHIQYRIQNQNSWMAIEIGSIYNSKNTQ